MTDIPRAPLCLTRSKIRIKQPLARLREIVIAGAITLLALASVHAQEVLPEWLPDSLVFPTEYEIASNREIGETVRMLSVDTDADISGLIANWEAALQEDGYAITQRVDDLLDDTIEFSGHGISNAKIVAKSAAGGNGNRIEFDATLE
ncbi:hypothetical protein [Qingshengfaniella alkalisoli]|uniref:Uncharacterized protein n=1 Tax=Qingshengfaniella alkalisoli TaxID=2599296 RepID=A0A5B8I8G2_9RHOB|nr:hypothetical protein [Qingshengfaniella alkalisoli]QDY68956.1 hypothetical protein FPZ52_04475 [Qingshengfaniella alkalisoli]